MPHYQPILDHLRALIADALGVSPETVSPEEPFDRLGLASRDAVMLSGDLQDWLKCDLPPNLLYEYPTPAQLAAYLAERTGGGIEMGTRRSASFPAGTSSPLSLDMFEEGRV